MYWELAARPHARADGRDFKNVHHAVANPTAKTASMITNSATRGDDMKRREEANAAKFQIANRTQTRAVNRCIQDRYFLSKNTQRFFLGKLQSTQHRTSREWLFWQFR